jgi:hypothetical protein
MYYNRMLVMLSPQLNVDLMDMYRMGRLARKFGQSRENFQKYRWEALQLGRKLGDNFLYFCEREMRIVDMNT